MTFVGRIRASLQAKVLAIIGTMLIAGIITAGFIAVSIQKRTVYRLTELGSEKTAQVVFQNIETTMLEGKADVTKKIIENISRMRGIQEIALLNPHGGEAFSIGSPPREAGVLSELKSGSPKVVRKARDRLTIYLPLANTRSCQSCHEKEKTLLGAVKLSISIENEYREAMSIIAFVIFLTVVAALLLSVILWVLLRRMVIVPIRAIEQAASRIREGELTFDIEIRGADEIGRASLILRDSFQGIQGVLERIKELSERILVVVHEVEQESGKVLKGAESEAEATGNISASVEELNATATEISDSTRDLAESAGHASASIDQMVSSIKTIDEHIQELAKFVESTSASIHELSATVREVAHNAEDLAQASDETVSAITEITTVTREVEASAKESAVLSEKATNDAATLGMDSISKTMAGMKEIAASVQNTAQCISVLGNRSKEIEKILNVIEAVNDETTLLSLNAAILAAQAKEHGKGFGVVASEMKALSERTGQSTEEIGQLIQGVRYEVANAEDAMAKGIRAVEQGLRLSKESEEALRKVLESSRKSSEMSEAIRRSTTEQARAAGLVMQATGRIRDMIASITKATAEQSKGVALIAEAAHKMEELSREVSKATNEQAATSGQISQVTELVSERSSQISHSINEHRKGSESILRSLEAVRDIPVENRNRAFRISGTLWNLQRDAELLKTEMERFSFSEHARRALRFGIVPLQDPSVMFRKFTPLSDYLSGKLGQKVDLRVAVDMESAIRDIGENTTQLCAMGPANYIEAHARYGVKVIVKAMRQGKASHRAAVVVSASSGVRSVHDLKGKSFAFVSPKSATGHIMPLSVLKLGGIMLGDLGHYDFLGHHEKVVRGVLDGTYDAGGMMEETAHKYRERGLKILELSAEIPEFNICCNPGLDRSVVDELRSALVALDAERDALVLKSLGKDCTGFIVATERDYDFFRELISGLGSEVNAEAYGRFRHSSRSGKD